MRSLAKALRPLFALGLLGVACAAQSGAAQAQGGLNDFFSQLFAPPPQPSYVQPLVVPRGGPLARPQRGYVPRSRSADRVSPVRLPRAVPLRVRHASLPAPKDQTSLPRRGEGKAESPKPIKIVPREPGSDPAGQILHDATLRRGDIVVLPGGAKVFKGGREGVKGRGGPPFPPQRFGGVPLLKAAGGQAPPSLDGHAAATSAKARSS